MNRADFLALLPLLVLAAGVTALMLQVAINRRVGVTSTLTVVIFGAAALSAIPATGSAPLQVTPLLLVDRMALLFCMLFCVAGGVTALLSREYIRHHGDEPEEYFLLLVLATLGACVLAMSVHVASLLLGLELLTVSLYALIAYPNKSILPLEAAIKYLVLSGAASATLLFGFALLYAVTGALEFGALGRGLDTAAGNGPVLMVGAAMAVAGFAFKLSAVPFHLWTPDVYSGAPAPVTGFLATVGKAAVAVVLLRLFLTADLFRYSRLVELVGLMAILSMLAGNLQALLQTNIKRMLAYSSIAHIGYLLIVFMACLTGGGRAMAIEAAAFYLIAYTATNIAAFGLLSLVNARGSERENVQLRDVEGLFWHAPLLAALMTVALLSLAGIPLTAGFIGKFYLFNAAVDGGNWVLLGALIIGSGIGIYYYLRVLYHMSLPPDGSRHPLASATRAPLLALFLIGVILVLGTLPQPLAAYLEAILRF